MPPIAISRAARAAACSAGSSRSPPSLTQVPLPRLELLLGDLAARVALAEDVHGRVPLRLSPLAHQPADAQHDPHDDDAPEEQHHRHHRDAPRAPDAPHRVHARPPPVTPLLCLSDDLPDLAQHHSPPLRDGCRFTATAPWASATSPRPCGVWPAPPPP